MTIALLQQHWALLIASIVGTAVLMFVGWRAWLGSTHGRLQFALRRLRAVRREADRKHRALRGLAARRDALEARADSVKPLRLQEAREAVQDGEALLKIANDQLLIAENHVRKIIVEEFPPNRHGRMRRKYLPGESGSNKPFTF